MSRGSWGLLNAIAALAAFACGVAAQSYFGTEKTLVAGAVTLVVGSFFLIFWEATDPSEQPPRPPGPLKPA